MVMAGFCINAMLVAVPMQIQQPIGTGYGLGASATLTGFMLVPAMLIGTTAPLATWIERKLGQRTATIVGPVSIAAAAFSLMASAGNFTMVLIGLLLVGFGCGISITQAMNLVVSGVPPLSGLRPSAASTSWSKQSVQLPELRSRQAFSQRMQRLPRTLPHGRLSMRCG